MKKLLITFILAVATSGLMAQLSLGPKIGYTASKLSTESDDIKEDFNNTLHFGAFARLGGKTYLQPELLFMTKGATLDYSIGEGFEQEVSLNTIDIPLLVGFKLIDLKIADIRVMGGPVASFVTNKDVDNVDAVADELKGNDIKDSSWGLQAGVGADFLSLSLDIRYDFGLSNIYDGEETQSFNTSDIKNNAFLVTLGWKIL